MQALTVEMSASLWGRDRLSTQTGMTEEWNESEGSINLIYIYIYMGVYGISEFPKL